MYYALDSNIRVKSYGHLNFSRASILNFKRLDLFLAWIEHPRQKLGWLNLAWAFMFNF